MSPLLRAVPTCCICGKLLQLENCNFDEDGQAVHEDCYTLKLLLGKNKSTAKSAGSLSEHPATHKVRLRTARTQ
jgi:hypothetical protein